MSVLQIPPCPPSLKSVQHYLKTASEHETRDPVIAYWCRLYSLQSALRIDKKSDDAKALLMILIEWLEKQKKVLSDNEAITNEVAAQAHVENYALKLFLWADGQDRAGIFNKNVVKAFYTSAMLMDVLTTFGEPSEEIMANCKYAKWKAAYIHNCLRNGETPVPGPVGYPELEDEEGGRQDEAGGFTSTNIGFSFPSVQPTGFENEPGGEDSHNTITFPSFPTEHDIPWNPHHSGGIEPPPPSPLPPSAAAAPATTDYPDPGTGNSTNVKLGPEQINKAQKYCKFAASALNYDDVSEAVNNLQKALRLLQTGHDN